MALNLSRYDAVLKEFYEGAVRETINSEVPAFAFLDESDREYSGRRVMWPVRTSRNSGVGARGEATNLPVAGQQGYNQAIVSAAYNYGRIRFSGQVLRAGKNAFADAAQSEMDGVTKDLKNDLGRQTWGDGTGRLAQIATSATAGTGSLVVPLFNRYAETQQPGARFLYVGQLVDVGSLTSPTSAFSSQVISAISLSTSPGTTTDSITLGGTSVLFSSSEHFVYNHGAGLVEMMGIQGLVDDFTQANMWGSNAFAGSQVQNINRASVSQWNSIVLANSGVARVVDSNLIQTAFDQIHIQSGKDADFIWAQHDVCRAFLDSVAADRRYVTGQGAPKYDAGYSGLSYNGAAIVRDRQAPYNCMLVGVKSSLKIYTLMDLQFASIDGSVLSRIADRDEWEAFLATYKNLGIDTSPKELCFIRDIRVDF